MFTQCPDCGAAFRVAADDLRQAAGKVRCGDCGAAFDALLYLSEDMPEPGTGVWVEFEAGDPSRPIWSGCWWGDARVPADNGGQSGVPSLRIIRSEEGLMIAFDDDSQTLTVSDGNGSNMLEIQVRAGKATNPSPFSSARARASR